MGKSFYRVKTSEGGDLSIVFSSYGVIARDGAEAAKKAAKVFALKAERIRDIEFIGAVDAE